MNIYKNLFKNGTKYCYSNYICPFNRKLHNLSLRRTVDGSNSVKSQKFTRRKICMKTKLLYCTTYNTSDIEEIEDITNLYPYLQNQQLSNSDIARNVLYQNDNDFKITELSKCASVEEVFTFVRNNSRDLNYKHLTQIVLVLSDLQNIFFYHLDEDTDVRESFFKKLLEHQEFYIVVNSIAANLDNYDVLFLSYTALYLNKLGLPVENHLIQNIAIKIRNYLLNDTFSLDISARFFRVIFTENSVRPYFTAIDVIPKVFGEIDSIKTLKELEDLTVCLTMMHNMITDNIIDQYINKIDQFVDNHMLKGTDYPILLKISALLNYPAFRGKNTSFIAKYILLMKDYIELMNFRELEILYHIFFKCQEPGDALNAIQRASAKILHEQEDNQLQRNTQLKLFSCLIYFSSPTHKMQFRKDILKYINERETLTNLLNLRKIYSYLKISDVKLCDIFWTKACQALKEQDNFDKVSRLFESYWSFVSDNPSYRSHAFEHHIVRIIQKSLDDETLSMIPQQFFSAFAFALVFCKDLRLMNRMMKCFFAISSQMTASDLLKISQVLNLMRQQRSVVVTRQQAQDIRSVLNEVTENLFTYNEHHALNTILIKAAILRGDHDNELIDDILQDCKHIKYMSSKMIENLSFCLLAPKALIPEVMNKCTEYIVHHKDHIIGFNAEKMLFLCYYLNYYPVYADKFFQTVTDLIIRDQERLSGLAFLQGALSLCYFNRLPKSFIKQIFNVEFLDKLDVELENCYYRDVYPQRVRNTLMQLNRAVCLEYPEYNIPWFHQKYIEELRKMNSRDDISVNVFQRSVKDYLMGMMNKNQILENVLAPYGYTINFVIHFDKSNTPTSNFEDNSNLRLALLLKSDNAFTRFYIRLKGKHELQNRHLEILGYKVKIINFNEWSNLLYASERVEFIKSLVFS